MSKNYFFLFFITVLFIGELQAQYAVGGTSENSDKVYWLTWGDPDIPFKEVPDGFDYYANKDDPGAIVSGEYIWEYSEDIQIVATISGLDAGELEPYTPGNWSGDRIGYLYSGAIDGEDLPAPRGVPYSGMVTPNGVEATFDISIAVEFNINGVWTPVDYPGIVIADAEEMDGSFDEDENPKEYISATTSGTKWQLLDRYLHDGNPDNYKLKLWNNISTNEKHFEIRANSSDAGTPSVMYAHNTKSISDVEMKGSGRSALAIGFVFPFDLGDAPESYGDNVRHYIDSFEMTEAFSKNGDYSIDDLPTTKLVPRATVYIGADNVDADGLGATQTGSDPDGANNDQLTGANDEGTIDVSEFPIKVNQDGDFVVSFPVSNEKDTPAKIYMWMDFDDDGRFQGDEIQLIDVPASVGDHPVEAVFPVSKFAGKIKAGSLYSRIRITTSNLLDDPGTPEFDERSTELAFDGETEDYRFIVEGVEISGVVTHDSNGITDSDISGPGIGSVEGDQLYAYLLGENNTVIRKNAVAANGTYSLSGINPGNYAVAISTYDGSIGGTDFDQGGRMPGKWRSVGAYYGQNNNAWETGEPECIENWNKPNKGVAVVIPMDGSDVFGVDFAIEEAPTVAAITLPPSPAGRRVVLTEADLENYLSDPEDESHNFATLGFYNPLDDTFVQELTIAREGRYSVITGASTTLEFQPVLEFSGETTPVSYSFRDAAGQESNRAEISITVEEATFMITNSMIYQRLLDIELLGFKL